MNQSFSSQLLDRVAHKLNSKVGFRADLYLGDYSPLGAASARALIGYSLQAAPTIQDVSAFVAKEFSGDLIPAFDTALAYPEEKAISIILTQNQPTLPVELKDDVSLMCPVTAATFIDTKLGDTWEVVDAGGSKCLQRVASATIEDLLRARKNSQMIKSSGVCFADVAIASVGTEVQKGDKVRIFADGASQVGTVTKVNATSLSIVNDAGTPFNNQPLSAVLEVIDRGEKSHADDDAMQREFYEKVYCNADGTPWTEFIDKLMKRS